MADSKPSLPQPDIEDGIEYWNSQPASYDGVLGGFGNGSLPSVDSLGSRQFLLHLMPELCTVPSAIRPLAAPPAHRRVRALDVGAGVGRVTADVLLHLVADVVLVEPVDGFVREALRRGTASAAGTLVEDSSHALWRGVQAGTTSVTFVQETLQAFDPAHPLAGGPTKLLGRVGYVPPEDDLGSGFNVIWCQWCLGHLRDADLVAFFRRCRAALRDRDKSVIVVKENLCQDGPDGSARTSFDESDSSVTRSDAAWKAAFTSAGLTLIHEQVQRGFPEELYEVKMYALR